jgi:hypothetical protein
MPTFALMFDSLGLRDTVTVYRDGYRYKEVKRNDEYITGDIKVGRGREEIKLPDLNINSIESVEEYWERALYPNRTTNTLLIIHREDTKAYFNRQIKTIFTYPKQINIVRRETSYFNYIINEAQTTYEEIRVSNSSSSKLVQSLFINLVEDSVESDNTPREFAWATKIRSTEDMTPNPCNKDIIIKLENYANAENFSYKGMNLYIRNSSIAYINLGAWVMVDTRWLNDHIDTMPQNVRDEHYIYFSVNGKERSR